MLPGVPLRSHDVLPVELLLLGACWAINLSPAGLAVAFLIVALVPLRERLLPKLFTREELERLDGSTPAVGADDDMEAPPEGAAAPETAAVDEDCEAPEEEEDEEAAPVPAPATAPPANAQPTAAVKNPPPVEWDDDL